MAAVGPVAGVGKGRAQLVAGRAKGGESVVRLISGDPVLDGSLFIEIQALAKAKVPFEVIPGVSPISGIPAYAGFGLTGGKAREVSVVDAHDTDLDFSAHV
ncbi:MAG: SAM-dependent methyltransferase, partial [Schleiferiaceae bacterium]